MSDKYEIKDGWLTGPGLRVEAAVLVEPERQNDPNEGKLIILDAITDLLNGAWLSGRASILVNYDERRALHETKGVLQAMKVIAGGLGFDRYDRMIAAIDRVLGQQPDRSHPAAKEESR